MKKIIAIILISVCANFAQAQTISVLSDSITDIRLQDSQGRFNIIIDIWQDSTQTSRMIQSFTTDSLREVYGRSLVDVFNGLIVDRNNDLIEATLNLSGAERDMKDAIHQRRLAVKRKQDFLNLIP